MTHLAWFLFGFLTAFGLSFLLTIAVWFLATRGKEHRVQDVDTDFQRVRDAIRRAHAGKANGT